jgi:hypothetical protein
MINRLFLTIFLTIYAITMSVAQLADTPWPMCSFDALHTGRSQFNGPATPKQKWTFVTGGDIQSSPSIAKDGTIYIGSYDGIFYAFNPDGTKKWVFKTGGPVISTSAIAADGTIYVGSKDLYALNPNGTQKWFFTAGGSVKSSPVIGKDGTIYVAMGAYFYAINPDGTNKWTSKFNYTGFESSPALGTDGTIYIGTGGRGQDDLIAFNPDGSEKWRFVAPDPVQGSPSIGTDGTIYFGAYDNKIYAFNPDGTKKWDCDTGNSIHAGIAIGADGTIYIGSYDEKFYAITSDGKVKWTFLTKSVARSTPIIDANGTIYFGSADNNYYAINPDGTQKWAFDIGDEVLGSSAIGADGTLYFGSLNDTFYAIGNSTAQTLTITPPTATLTIGATQQFTANPATGVTWTATGGTISNTGLYTAGNTAGIYIVTAKSAAGTATANVNISTVAQTLTINPPTATLNIGATQQFTATPATGITWSATGGTISNTGLYTAGNTAGTYTVTATSVAGTTTTNVNINTAQQSTLAITTPNGSEQLTQGTANPITWTSTGTPGNVKIELFKGGILNSTIAPSFANTGSYNWNIPATQPIGTDYQIKISAVANNTINSQSAGDFEIIAATPTATIFVTSPIGSEQWLQNSTHPITWSSTGNPGNIIVELLKNGVLNSIIAADIPDSGTYNWSIPQNQATGTDYQVRISAVANLQVTNQSAANFSILPGGNNPTLTAPTLYLPANNSINVPVPTKFIWSAVLNAVSYNMQLADDAQFAVNMQENNITSINASTTGLTLGATYYWRVQAVDNNGDTGAWSEVYVFKTITTPITYQYRPDLSITPANGATVGTDIYDVSGYTQWATLGASTTIPATYTITVTNNGTSDDVITLLSNSGVNGWKHTFVDVTGTDITAEISSTTGHSITLTAGASEDITLSTLAGPAGTSYLSITGKSKNLNSSFDTVVARAFKTDNNAPVFPRPVLTSPANNAIISGPLSWSSISTSTGYQIQVSTDADFRNPEFDNFVTNPNDTVGTLADDTTYYWRVRATDSDLALPANQYHWSEWSHVSLFRTVAASTAEAFDVNIYSKSLSSTPITMNPGDNNNQNPIIQGAKIRNSASYYVAITNRGNVKSQFTISDSTVLPSDSKLSGWRINITDMRANNITRKIFNSGSTFTTPFVDPGKKIYIRVEVAAGSNTSIGDSADANFSISSTNGTVDLFTTTVRE